MWSEHFYHVGTFYDPFMIDCSRKIRKKKGNKQVFFTAFDSVSDSQEEAYHDVSKPRKGTVKDNVVIVPGCWILDQSEKCSR